MFIWRPISYSTHAIYLLGQFWVPVSVSEISTRSSAYSRQFKDTDVSFTGKHECSDGENISITSLINMLNRIGLRLHPWQSTTFDLIEFVGRITSELVLIISFAIEPLSDALLFSNFWISFLTSYNETLLSNTPATFRANCL